MTAELTALKKDVLTQIDQRKDVLIDLLRSITQIPSVFGEEKEVQEFIADQFGKACDEVDIWEPDRTELEAHPSYLCPGTTYDGRPNVVGTIKGEGGGRSLIINAHCDVVPTGDPVTWKHDPWGGEIESGRMYGRGVMDDKAGLAAMMLIAKILKDSNIKLAGDLILQSVIGEEWGGGGSLATLLRGYRADGVIDIEPTECRILTVCRGGATFQIDVPGRGAHPIEPEKGVSAIEKAAKLLQALGDLREMRWSRFRRQINGEYPNLTPLVVGGIEGEIPQKVPERCVLKGLIGYPPEESYSEMKADLESFVAKAASLDPWLSEHPPVVTWEGFMKEGCEVPADHPFVQSCLKAQGSVVGREIPPGSFRAATDLHYYVRYWNLPGIIFGPGNCVVAHSSDEWLDLNEFMLFTKTLAAMILDWSGKAS